MTCAHSPVKLAVAGKGGAGKSVLAGTLARAWARRGHRVLALDSDFMPGLAISLGAEAPREPPLNAAAERGDNGRWRLKRGIGPVRAVERFATVAPDGVRLLQAGKFGPEGLAPIMPAVQAFYRVVHGLRRAPAFRGWTVVGDLPAGPRQAAFDWAPYADTVLVAAEPTWTSALTAGRIARIARSRVVDVVFVATKVGGAGDLRLIERLLGEAVLAAIPLDDAVSAAERAGLAPIDSAPHGPAVRAVERLADALAGHHGSG